MGSICCVAFLQYCCVLFDSLCWKFRSLKQWAETVVTHRCTRTHTLWIECHLIHVWSVLMNSVVFCHSPMSPLRPPPVTHYSCVWPSSCDHSTAHQRGITSPTIHTVPCSVIRIVWWYVTMFVSDSSSCLVPSWFWAVENDPRVASGCLYGACMKVGRHVYRITTVV